MYELKCCYWLAGWDIFVFSNVCVNIVPHWLLHQCWSGILDLKHGLLCKIGDFVYGQQHSSSLAAGPIVSLLVHGGVHFLTESPKCLLYQHTPACDGERDQDQALLSLLRHPVARKSKSFPLKLNCHFGLKFFKIWGLWSSHHGDRRRDYLYHTISHLSQLL